VKTFNQRLNPAAAALAVLVVVLWGINTVSIKIALGVLPPLLTAGIRFVISLPLIGLWARLRHIPLRPVPGETKKLLLLTFLFVFQICMLYAGTSRTLASRATLFIFTYPFFTTVFAHYMIGGDRLNAGKVAGLALAFGGVVLVFAESLSTGSFATLTGDLMVLISGMAVGFRFVYTKQLTRGIPPVKLVFWQALMSLPFWFAASAVLERPGALQLNGEVLAALLYQGLVVAGFCFIVWTVLLHRYSASGLTVFAFLSPVSGVAVSSLLLSEPLSTALLAALVLIAGGIALVNRRTRKPRPQSRGSKKKAFRKGFPESPIDESAS